MTDWAGYSIRGVFVNFILLPFAVGWAPHRTFLSSPSCGKKRRCRRPFLTESDYRTTFMPSTVYVNCGVSICRIWLFGGWSALMRSRRNISFTVTNKWKVSPIVCDTIWPQSMTIVDEWAETVKSPSSVLRHYRRLWQLVCSQWFHIRVYCKSNRSSYVFVMETLTM